VSETDESISVPDISGKAVPASPEDKALVDNDDDEDHCHDDLCGLCKEQLQNAEGLHVSMEPVKAAPFIPHGMVVLPPPYETPRPTSFVPMLPLRALSTAPPVCIRHCTFQL
jgi:hypothetical protein